MDSLLFTELAILIAVTFGWFMGLVTPYTIKWMTRVASHAQITLDARRKQHNLMYGKQQPTLQQKGTIGGTP